MHMLMTKLFVVNCQFKISNLTHIIDEIKFSNDDILKTSLEIMNKQRNQRKTWIYLY